MVLPLDLRVLYRWHDGRDPFTPDGYVELFPDEPFLPLGEAVGQYSMWLQGDPYWNPLWFPAFGDQHGAFVELGSTPNRLAGPVWDFHYQDSEVSAAFDSILAMVQTFVAVWRTADVNELELVGPDKETLREHNPRSFAPNGRRTRVLSKGVMEGWPEEWIAAARPLPKELESDDRGRFYG